LTGLDYEHCPAQFARQGCIVFVGVSRWMQNDHAEAQFPEIVLELETTVER